MRGNTRTPSPPALSITHFKKQKGIAASMTATKTAADFTARGSLNGAAKLTAQQVIEMRLRYFTARKAGDHGVTMLRLAREYGISKEQVRNILHRRQWTHV